MSWLQDPGIRRMPRIAFSTASLAPAIYHYQVRGSSGIIGLGKLTILR